jgi:hypothetical protein
VRRSALAFQTMMRDLGEQWAFLVTDVTDGRAGNSERLAFVFDTTRLQPSGLACELVVAAQDAAVPVGGMTEQFARTPYAVGFARDDVRFTLVTLHVLYGDAPADRIPELRAIAQWLARWSARKDPWGENLIALGDFNIDRRGDPLYQAFTSTGLQPPAALNHIPRTIFDDPDDGPDNQHFYDQIAWFPDGRAELSMPFVNAAPSTSRTGSSRPKPKCSCPGGSPTTSRSGASSPRPDEPSPGAWVGPRAAGRQARSRNPFGVTRNPASVSTSARSDPSEPTPSARSTARVPSHPSCTAPARAWAAATSSSRSVPNDSRDFPPRSTYSTGAPSTSTTSAPALRPGRCPLSPTVAGHGSAAP